MADREDFAAEVGQLIKGRSPVGHTHTRIDTSSASLLLDASGGVQHYVDGARKFRIDATGTVIEGTVPWARVDGKPETFPPTAHTHDDRYYTETETDQKLATKSGTSHTHFAISTNDGTSVFRFYAGGQIQHQVNGAPVWVIQPDGSLLIGKVPWARITGAPDIPAPREDVADPAKLAPLLAALSNAGTRTAPIAFVGSSTTAWHNYPPALIDAVTAAYDDGQGGGTILATDTPVTPYTGTGVVGYNLGIGGATAATYVSQVELDNLAAIQPAAILHGIGSNDYAAGVAPATYEAQMRGVLASIDAVVTVPHVHVLMQQHKRAGTFAHPWADYTDAMRRIAADTPNATFVNLGPALDALDPMGADPLNLGHGDGVHLAPAGAAVLAEAMARALGVPGRKRGAVTAGPIEVAVNAADTTGSITLWRDGDNVYCDLNEITMPAGNNALHVVQIPLGYRPQGEPIITAASATEPVAAALSSFQIYWAGHLTWIGNPDRTLTRPTTPLRGTATWRTADPFPS